VALLTNKGEIERNLNSFLVTVLFVGRSIIYFNSSLYCPMP